MDDFEFFTCLKKILPDFTKNRVKVEIYFLFFKYIQQNSLVLTFSENAI